MPDEEIDDIWELGVMRIFGRHDISPRSLISGWAQPEDQHVWNNGIEAVLQVIIPKPGRPITLSLECIPFVWESCPEQQVTLFVNGVRQQFWRLTERRIHVIDATIEPAHLIDRGNHSLLTCVWLLPNSTRPKELGTGADLRELALCFQAMTIS